MSQANTNSQPPAVARPSTAAIIGLLSFAINKPAESALGGIQCARLAAIDCLQVGSSTKHWTLLACSVRSQNSDPHRWIILHLIDSAFHSLRHITVYGVAGIRTIQRDVGDFSLNFV